jgi:transposase InsO family protein
MGLRSPFDPRPRARNGIGRKLKAFWGELETRAAKSTRAVETRRVVSPSNGLEYTEGWYNPRRRQPTLGYLSPIESGRATATKSVIRHVVLQTSTAATS